MAAEWHPLAAELRRLSVSRQTLYRWLAQGLPSVKVGGIRRFDPDLVDQWLAERNEAA